jgi:hypothetical protein
LLPAIRLLSSNKSGLYTGLNGFGGGLADDEAWTNI